MPLHETMKANSELAALVRLHEGSYKNVKDVIEFRLAGGEPLEVVLSRPRSRSASVARSFTDQDS